jgi:hypothetical protein
MACGGGHGRPCRVRPARHDNAGIDSLHHAVPGGVRSAIRVCCRSGGGACRPRYTMSASPLRWKSAPCAPSCSIHFHQDFGWEIRCGHGGPKKWCLILLFFTKRTAHRRKRLICLYSSLNYFERYMDRSAVSAVCRCFIGTKTSCLASLSAGGATPAVPELPRSVAGPRCRSSTCQRTGRAELSGRSSPWPA